MCVCCRLERGRAAPFSLGSNHESTVAVHHFALCTPLFARLLLMPNAWCSGVTWLSNRVPCGLLARACEKDLRHAAPDQLTHKTIHARTHTQCVKEQASACHQSIIGQPFCEDLVDKFERNPALLVLPFLSLLPLFATKWTKSKRDMCLYWNAMCVEGPSLHA